MHSAAQIGNVRFWSKIRLSTQRLGKYTADVGLVQISSTEMLRVLTFRTESFTAFISFDAMAPDVMRECRFTTVQSEFDTLDV